MQHNTLSNLRYPFNYLFPPHTIHNTPLSTAKTCYKTSTSNKKRGKKKHLILQFFQSQTAPPSPIILSSPTIVAKNLLHLWKTGGKKKKENTSILLPFQSQTARIKPNRKINYHPTLSPSRTPSRSSAHAFSRGLGKRNPRGINCIHGDATEQSRFIRKQWGGAARNTVFRPTLSRVISSHFSPSLSPSSLPPALVPPCYSIQWDQRAGTQVATAPADAFNAHRMRSSASSRCIQPLSGKRRTDELP